MSLPAWGEWIEITLACRDKSSKRSLPAWGEWIEIAPGENYQHSILSLSPHGESGLKFAEMKAVAANSQVSPRMGRVD